MDYLVKIKNRNYGPVDELTLEDWVVEGRILPNTLIEECNSNKKLKAGDLLFLEEAFTEQAENFIQSRKKNPIGLKLANTLNIKYGADVKCSNGVSGIENKEESVEYSTVKKIFLRVKAALIDMFILIIIYLSLFSGLNYFLINYIKYNLTLNLLLYLLFAICLVILFCYFVFQISYFNITFGMKLSGLKMIRHSNGLKDISLLRAFCYTVIMLFFCGINLVMMSIWGRDIFIQDLITDIKIIRR